MMAIHTVAAGGGSILHFDGSRFRVGPDSRRRRSRPGLLRPRRAADRDRRQCHARARSSPAIFPHVFGPSGDQPLDAATSRAQIRRAGRRDRRRHRQPRAPGAIAEGFLTIAVEQHGQRDQADLGRSAATTSTRYALACFGGAGGQHACLVADALGMTTVLIHPLAGVLSAYGMGLADMRRAARAGGRGAAVDRSALTSSMPARRPTLRPRGARRGAGPGRARPAGSAPNACICATRAPTPRSSVRVRPARRR